MNDDTADLLQLFAKLGTTDHDELIKQMQTIIPGVDAALCTFFLEASNWTLQTAILSFFDSTGGREDFGQQIALLNKPKPNATFVLRDDGVSQYYTDTPFCKVWAVTNTGSIPWPEGSSLDFAGGDQLGGPQSIQAPVLPPGTTIDITINFRTPPQPGQYAGSWSMTTKSGGTSLMFGEQVWVVVVAVQNPHQTAPMGWSGFGSFPQQHQQTGPDGDMTMG